MKKDGRRKTEVCVAVKTISNNEVMYVPDIRERRSDDRAVGTEY